MDSRQFHWTLAVLLLTTSVHVWCFLPSRTTSTPPDSYSHVEITTDGVKKAAANFLNDNGLVDGSYRDADRVLNKYFGSDVDSQERFKLRITELSTRMNTVQRDFKNIAKYTVNGERIEDAYNLVRQFSAQTRTLTSVDPYNTGEQESTFDNLAKALLVIQSFYSNTNWVEMNGDDYCPAFGGEGDLPKITKAWEETCSYCDPNARFDCFNNIVTDDLTSAFLPDQDIKIPYLNDGTKCGQDWNIDRFNGLAIGGIGKDTTDSLTSPHADDHPQAALAAIRATTAYLYQNGKGILSSLSVDNFKKLFVLDSLAKTSRASLTIVMDVSGSMSADIQAARDACVNLVSAVQGTPNEPADYVLATFSDPETLTTGEIFTSGDAIIDRLNNLVPKGGQDCPEYSLSGILKGLSLSKPGSDLYTFTDADAKDSRRMNEVNATADAKRIKLNFLLTSSCSKRRRRATGRVVRAIDDVYTQLAVATGGKVYQTTKSQLGAVLSTIMHEDMPSSDVLVQTFQMSPSDSDRKVVVVDPTMLLFKVEVGGAASENDVSVKYPNGSTLQYHAGVASRYNSAGKVIISVQKPIAGKWTIMRTTTRLLTVNATGSSPFDFSFKLAEQDERGNAYSIRGSPITGNNYTISTQMFNLDRNASLESISLVNLYGNEVEKIETSLHRTGTETFAVADITIPAMSVRVQITGVLPDGESFQRTNFQVISPVSVRLRLGTNPDPFPFNEPQNITYELGNHGDTNQTFAVKIDTDTRSLPTVYYALYHGEVNEYNFQVIGQPISKTLKYTVSVREDDSDVILQSLSSTVLFENPVCDVIYNEGTCPEKVHSPASCRSITWFSRAVFSPEVTSHEISNNDITNVEITVDYTTSDGIKYINVSGDCCTPSVYLSTLGSSGHVTGQCHFNFGSLPTVTLATAADPTPSDVTPDWTLFGWIVGVTCACLTIIGAVAVWYRRRNRKLSKTIDTDINNETALL